MKARKAWLKFMNALRNAPPGADWEIGAAYLGPKKRWRVYQRIGAAYLFMVPQDARALHQSYLKHAERPEWREVAATLAGMYGTLLQVADEADQKNRDGVVPPEWLAAQPAGDTA